MNGNVLHNTAANGLGSRSSPLPLIGVFWDIENCSVPKGKSALAVVQKIRERLFKGHREAEFMCVCDVNKEHRDVIQELNDAQVTVVHINATSKNAADDKLRQSLRRFGNTHMPPATVVLISGDVNFAAELSDLRHRHNLNVVLVHQHIVQDALLACAHEHYSYEELMVELPGRIAQKITHTVLVVSNLPDKEIGSLRMRLKMLSDNCGGRVLSIRGSSAVIRFPNSDAAARAKKRMDGEIVYDNQISVDYSDSSGAKSKVMKVRQDNKCQSPKGAKLTISPASSPQGHSSPKAGHLSGAGTYPYKKGDDSKDSTTNVATGSNKPTKEAEKTPVVPKVSKTDSTSTNSTRKDLTQMRKRLGSGSDCKKTVEVSPQLKVMPRKHSDGSRFGPIVSHSGGSPTFKLINACAGANSSGRRLSSGSGGNTSASSPVPSNLQTVVNKFSKDHKSSREVLFLQQQLFQEQQEKQIRGNDSIDSLDCASVRSCPPFRGSPMFREFPPYRPHSGGGNYQPHRHGGYHSNSRMSPDLNRTYAGESFFRPINDSPISVFGSAESSPVPQFGVELVVSNLDYNISGREWKKIIQTTFQQQVQILGVTIQPQPDNTSVATVCVPSVDEARFAISQFHRKKIGYKRIHVAIKPTDQRSAVINTRYEVVALLRSVPDNSLPLFKFIELFEKRYHRNISVSELYKMRDIVDIHEQGGSGRMVCLTSAGKCSPVPPLSPEADGPEFLETPVCTIHCLEGSENYMVSMEMTLLPNVVIPLRHLAAQVHTLLLNHDGSMPLLSFACCYTAEFTELSEVAEGGVSLEHLISCVPGVSIELSHGGVKKVKLSEKKPFSLSDSGRGCPSPVMSYHLTQFNREVVDMLKNCPSAILTFNKFIPFYHHHFGRQCRVADYGYTKLSELFEALPHVLQVLGCGNQKLLTLSSRIQTKRFQADLIRVLKAQPTKQISVSMLSQAFEKVNGKPLYMPDYGVCYLDDMMNDIPETTATVTPLGEDIIIALPRHDQTPEEIERTRMFAAEVVELLKHSRQCRMPFNKFVPAYHHHFGRQCKVSDYGFTKLIELFESIPDIVQIIEELDDKVICLTDSELLRVFAEQTTGLLKAHNRHTVPLQYFLPEFMRFHGYCMRLQDYKVTTVDALLKKIDHVVKIECVQGRQMVSLVDRSSVQQLAYRVIEILIDQPGGDLRIPDLLSTYSQLHGEPCPIEEVKDEMIEIIEIHGNMQTGTIQLCPLQMFARSVRSLLQANQNKLPLQNFEEVYMKHYGMELNSFHYGYPTVTSLLQAISHMVTIRGRGVRRTVLLCQDFINRLSLQVAYKNLPTRILCGPVDAERKTSTPSNDSGIMDEDKDNGDDRELLLIAANRPQSPADLLSDRLPSGIPSPVLAPSVVDKDLIELMSASNVYDALSSLSADEKKAQRTPLCQTPTSEMLQFAAQLLPPVHQMGPQESTDHQAFKDKIQELQNLLNSSPEELSPTKTPKKCRIAANFNVPIAQPRNG